ncbi:MAG: sigma-70 family RNA polymerase sigma factor [Mobilitalea sp.]
MDDKEYLNAIDKFRDVVYRVTLNYCKSRYDAEDVLQNTFLKLLKTDTEFKDEEHIRRWLIRVAVNECKNLFASFWRRNVGSLETLEGELVFTKQEESDLFEVVMKLPKKYRVVVHLFYYEGYATAEIAQILHIKETTVRTQLVRARKSLKEQLKEVWFDE